MSKTTVPIVTMSVVLAVAALAACRPEVVTVEVTRLVEGTESQPETAAPVAPVVVEATATPEPAATLPPPDLVAPTPVTITSVMTATVEVTRPPLGTVERPVQLLFPPVADSAVITQRTQPLVESLEAATGREFEVGIIDSEEALVALLCAAPADTIGFVSAAAYTLAHDQCDAQPGLVARHDDGLTWQAGMLVVPAVAGVSELSQLDGRTWAVADEASLPETLYFEALLTDGGVESNRQTDFPEETSALTALLDDQVGFATASFVPPIMPLDGEWVIGEDDPEVWRFLGISPSRSPIGYVIVAGEPELGGYRLRDARARLFDTRPEIFDRTRILTLSEPIPNETITLGAEFPLSLAGTTLATLNAFAVSDACQASLCSADFYGWTGLEPVEDAAYDPIRFVISTLDLESGELWARLDPS